MELTGKVLLFGTNDQLTYMGDLSREDWKDHMVGLRQSVSKIYTEEFMRRFVQE